MTAATSRNIANGLGWFSIGLGLAEVAAPRAVANLIGLRGRDKKTRAVLRTFGVREMAAGIGILMQPRTAGWVWGRVAGDALDLASLGSALQSRRTNKTRLATAAAAVAGVTVLDIVCGAQLSVANNGAGAKKTSKATGSLMIDRSPEETYRFWRDFENLPKFMTYLESVQTTGDKRSHWKAIGPAGRSVEWDAEMLVDEPNREIAWRSVEGSGFPNSGSVRFEKAPGDRGTLVRVEMQYAPLGGLLPSALGKVSGIDLGQRIQHDLRNFKQMLELGEVTQSDASIHAGMHAAQPANGHS